MSAETKQKALEKLNSFNRKLGYPDKWEDYSKLIVKRDSYLENYFRAQVFGFEDMVDQLNKPVDKSKWNMLPQTVNAYYSPVMNEIVFPAAIMQPPFFDPTRDDAANYGAIGAVIGHEFSHGFDDQGSKYDAKGNLNSWWTDEDRKKFEERTKVLVEQFNKFEVLDSVFVNGQLTLGENIADLAGLTVAYEAYQMSIKDKKRTVIDGFTPEQRFFIGFAQVWRTHARPEYLRNQVLTDPHSPAQFRVFGPLSNMPQFYAAFQVKPKNKMWLDENKRVKIW
jgi:putative endopeptidase